MMTDHLDPADHKLIVSVVGFSAKRNAYMYNTLNMRGERWDAVSESALDGMKYIKV